MAAIFRTFCRLRPDLQQLRVGDAVRMHASGFGLPVSILVPQQALVLGGPSDARGSQATWAFHLFDDRDGSRLIERGRGAPGKGVLAKLGAGPYLMDPIGFVMSRKMLHNQTARRVGPRPQLSVIHIVKYSTRWRNLPHLNQ